MTLNIEFGCSVDELCGFNKLVSDRFPSRSALTHVMGNSQNSRDALWNQAMFYELPCLLYQR